MINEKYRGLIGRILMGALVVAITAWITPGFAGNLFSYIIAAILIGVIDYAVLEFTGVSSSPFGKGAVGFLTAALVLYVAAKLTPGMYITVMGALIGALVMGIVESIIPIRK